MKKLIAVLVVVGSLLSVPSIASAQSGSNRATWQNAGTITFRGATYYDQNPYDGDRNAKASGDFCGDINYNGDRTTAAASFGQTDEFGECDAISVGDINFTNPAQGFVAGYKTSDTEILFIMLTDDGQTAAIPLTASTSRPGEFYSQNSDGNLSGDGIRVDSDGSITPLGGLAGILSITDGSLSGFRISNDPPDEGTLDSVVNVDEEGEDNSSCESLGGAMGWILCPVVVAIDGAMNWLDTQIQGLLEIDTDKYTNPELREAWVNFRNIAYAVLIPIMLVMVIGTALGFEVFSAYTIKKALPRMVIAVIFITLSWYITSFLIGFFNVIGGGVLGLITSPFGESGNMNLATLFGVSGDNLGDAASTLGSSAIQWGTTVTVLGGLGLLISQGGLALIMLYLGAALLFILTAFLVLILRQMFIIGLILLAPLAILAWIFPGNDAMWKLWWKTFSRLLMMFPLIMVLIGAGRVFAYLIDISGGGGVDSIINPLLKLAAYVLPYALIPLTFKYAGGVFANLAGMVNDTERGLFDRMKKARGERWGDWNDRRKSGNLYQNAPKDSRRAKFNERAERLSHIGAAGFAVNKDVRKARIDTVTSNSDFATAHQQMKENNDLAVLLGNEDYAEAGRSGLGYVKNANGAYVDASGQVTTDMSRRVRRDGSDAAIRAYLSSRGYGEADVQAVRRARRGMSQKVFDIASVLSIPGTGTGFSQGAGEMDAAINETAGSDRRLATAMLAEMRGTAERASRGDLKGGGFGSRREALENQMSREIEINGRLARGEITQAQADSELERVQLNTTMAVSDMAVYSTDSRGLMSIKPKQIEQKIVPSVLASLTQAATSGDQSDYERQLAKIASLYDQAQYSSPEVQEIISKLMSRPINAPPVFAEDGSRTGSTGPTISVREAVENARGNRDFLNHRREFGGQRSQAEVARMSAEERAEYERQLQAQQEQQES